MAMRTERHGNLFAKLNYGNVSNGRMRVQERACVPQAARIGDPVHVMVHAKAGHAAAKLTKQHGG
jgi:hypothetical protein